MADSNDMGAKKSRPNCFEGVLVHGKLYVERFTQNYIFPIAFNIQQLKCDVKDVGENCKSGFFYLSC